MFLTFLNRVSSTIFSKIKVRNTAKIRKRHNQAPHLTQDTTWESNKRTINITSKSQEVSPFPAGDHKAAMNRRESMRNTRHKRSTKEGTSLGTVSKNILLEGQPHPLFRCGSKHIDVFLHERPLAGMTAYVTAKDIRTI